MPFAVFIVALILAGVITSYVFRKLSNAFAVSERPFTKRLLLTLVIIIACAIVCFISYAVVTNIIMGIIYPSF
jgi:uncharacterized membrane protein